MTRSLKKGYYADIKLLKKIAKQDESGEKKIIKTWARSSSVLPQMVGHTFAIHNGKSFFTLYVTEEMLGHKFGEFAFTRTFKGHPF